MTRNSISIIGTLTAMMILLSCASTDTSNSSMNPPHRPISYQCVVPDDVPEVLIVDISSSPAFPEPTTYSGKVLYRANHVNGWFACLEQFMNKQYDPFSPEIPDDPRHGFSMNRRLWRGWAEGFTDCRNTIREIGQKDQAATLREQLLKMRDEFNKRPEIAKARAELAALPNRDDANITNNQPVLAKYHEIESYLSKEWRDVFIQPPTNPE